MLRFGYRQHVVNGLFCGRLVEEPSGLAQNG